MAGTGATPAPTRTARRRPTRDVILEAASELMVADGVSATSVEQIARHAGCQRATIYTHFGSKESLALAVLEALVAHWAHASAAGPRVLILDLLATSFARHCVAE